MADEIWVVDDDRGVRFVLVEALRDAGLTVREFGEAGALRAALQVGRPGLLLTDVRMPGEDGLSLLVDLQQQGIGPVIVMSAFTDVATTAAAYRATTRSRRCGAPWPAWPRRHLPPASRWCRTMPCSVKARRCAKCFA